MNISAISGFNIQPIKKSNNNRKTPSFGNRKAMAAELEKEIERISKQFKGMNFQVFNRYRFLLDTLPEADAKEFLELIKHNDIGFSNDYLTESLRRIPLGEIISDNFKPLDIPEIPKPYYVVPPQELMRAMRGGKDVPEKLYHMTTYENANSIINDKFIRQSAYVPSESGVYMSDMFDIKNRYPKQNLADMINWYSGHSNWHSAPKSESHAVAIFEIPIERLDKDFLQWRPIKLPGLDNTNIPDDWFSFKDFTSLDLSKFHQRALEFLYKRNLPISCASNVKARRVRTPISEDRVDIFINKFEF